jgi:MFS family permease
MLSSITEPRSRAGWGERLGPEARTLAVTCAATALVLVAFTLPVGILAPIGADLGTTATGRTWILSSMSIGLAGTLLVAGSLADDLGRRRVFLAGLWLFTLSSVASLLAPGTAVLTVARVAQGVGGGALLATSLGLLAHAFPDGERRTHATGLWGAMIGVGVMIGPVMAALLSEAASWRVAYAVLALLSLALVAPAARGLTESRAAHVRRIDLRGLVLLCAGMVVLTAAIVQGNAFGWTSSPVLGALVGGLALLAAFAACELRRAEPLLDLRLLRNPAFAAALLASFVLGLTVLAFMSYSVTFLQTTLATGILAAALWSLAWSVPSILVAMRARAISRRLAPRAQTAGGLVLCAAGLLAMLGLDGASRPAHLLPGLLVLGVGTGVLNASVARAAVASVPPDMSSMGAGANNTMRYLGAALGVALLVALLHASTTHPTAAAEAHAMNTVLWIAAATTLAGAVAAFALLRPRAPAAAPAVGLSPGTGSASRCRAPS